MEFFCETCLIDMLEPSDYDFVDIIAPFIGAVIDEFCGLFEITDVTKAFCKLCWRG